MRINLVASFAWHPERSPLPPALPAHDRSKNTIHDMHIGHALLQGTSQVVGTAQKRIQSIGRENTADTGELRALNPTLSLASAFSVYSSLSQVLRKVLSTPLALPFFSFSRLSLLLPPSFFTKALSSPAIFSMTKLPLQPQARCNSEYQRQINKRIVLDCL